MTLCQKLYESFMALWNCLGKPTVCQVLMYWAGECKMEQQWKHSKLFEKKKTNSLSRRKSARKESTFRPTGWNALVCWES